MCMENVNQLRNNQLFSNTGTNCEAGLSRRGQTFAYLKGALPLMDTLRLLLPVQQLLGSKF